MAQHYTPLTFTVRRRAPELIRPAKPTPRELKPLSDIDDQEGLRFHIPVIQFYRSDPKMRNKNPASVIREALGKVLIFYYPLAGRLKEGPGRKLIVDCTEEGALFIEAEADVTLKQLGDALQPPFPSLEELLCDVPGSCGFLDSPLLMIQVTRFLCGGFIFALRLNHTMCDALGLVQFMIALGEMAQGASSPSISPVWQRDLLFARNPPQVTCTHHEYDEVADTKVTIIPLDNMELKLFFFGPAEVATLSRLVPSYLQKCSTFEVLTASLWRCRTIALNPDPDEEMRILYAVNVRNKINPPLPIGYYGNGIMFNTAISSAGDLSKKPLGYALELVVKAKSNISEEYVRSTTDLMVTKNRPHFTIVGTYLVSDVTRVGFDVVDFGWGKAINGGIARGAVDVIPGAGVSFYTRFRNHKGEIGIVVPIVLPSASMEIFVHELNNMLARDTDVQGVEEHKLPVLPRL